MICAKKNSKQRERNLPQPRLRNNKKTVVLSFSSFIIRIDREAKSTVMENRWRSLASLNCASIKTTIDNHSIKQTKQQQKNSIRGNEQTHTNGIEISCGEWFQEWYKTSLSSSASANRRFRRINCKIMRRGCESRIYCVCVCGSTTTLGRISYTCIACDA